MDPFMVLETAVLQGWELIKFIRGMKLRSFYGKRKGIGQRKVISGFIKIRLMSSYSSWYLTGTSFLK